MPAAQPEARMASSMLSPARSPLNSKPIAGTAFCILSCSSSWGCLVPRDSVETTKKVEGSGLLPRPAAAGRRNNACVGARGQAGRWPVLRRTLAPPCRFTPKLRGGAHGDQTSARARHASRKPSTADLVVRLCEYCSPCRQAVRQMKKKIQNGSCWEFGVQGRRLLLQVQPGVRLSLIHI